jgi:hypothetical protein
MTLKINDNGVERDMTADELAAHEAWQKLAEAEAKIEAKLLTEQAKIKQATLAKLGLTADEVAALLS